MLLVQHICNLRRRKVVETGELRSFMSCTIAVSTCPEKSTGINCKAITTFCQPKFDAIATASRKANDSATSADDACTNLAEPATNSPSSSLQIKAIASIPLLL